VRSKGSLRAVVVFLCALSAHFAHAETRALLVGVSVYPQLAGKNLDGPANDLHLMRSVIGRLAIRGENVTELSELAGPSMLPTRANILASLDRLSQTSAAGDWVLVYFSGHGAQIPQSTSTRRAHRETDGMDEVFLPRDTGRWDPARGVVEGAIVDDEFGAFFDRIRARGAHIWAIFDTCHAGDLTRAGASQAAGRTVWRLVGPQDLGLPTKGGTRRARSDQVHRRAGLKPNQPLPTPLRVAASQTVAFFASQPDEPAAEEVFIDPLNRQTKRRFGIFTYHLYEAMANWSGSFDSLAKAVEHAYRDRPFPTPQFSGDLAQRFSAAAMGDPVSTAKLVAQPRP
jgi:hypothetical protein